MHRHIIPLFVASLLVTSQSVTFASGSESASPSVSYIPSFYRSDSGSRSASVAKRPVIAEEPYNLGKALFSGKYNLGKPKLTPLNIEEKRQRLVALKKSIPAAEQQNLQPSELSGHLSNREMNALEYYLRVRFKKFISNSPTWANGELPPKTALTR